MSTGDAFREREKALEESFFYKRNQELLERLKSELATEDQKQALCASSGISDEAVLESLVRIGICCETFAAVSLIPLVVVAWADGHMDQKERKAVMAAAGEEGITPGSLCHDLLNSWLNQEPPQALLDAWKDYVHVIADKLKSDELDVLKRTVLGRARDVAKAAGGILGIGSICREEREVLRELETAFPS